MTSVVAPPRYQRRPGVARPPRASPAPQLPRARSRSRSVTPGSGPRCTHCNAATLSHEDGAIVCRTCGVVLEQDGNFRAEIEFDETSSGAIQSRGTHVRGDQTHQRQYINKVAGASHVGREGTTASENAMTTARQKIDSVCTLLSIQKSERETGLYIFKKAYQRQFYRGRTLESVAVTAIYLAVRRASRIKDYSLMLIDFAEASQPNLNVFELGKMAKELQGMLYLTANLGSAWQRLETQKEGKSAEEIQELTAQQDRMARDDLALAQVDPEMLIERFCDRLDFDEMRMRVKKDAVMVAKSMNRNWMSTGRRPAGVAGAAVIIAARMNNFRRSLREVVLVAKVTELTLGKRIEEFKETQNSSLSVQDFRAIDHKNAPLDETVVPPSRYRKDPEWLASRASKKRKRRQKKGAEPETAAEIEDGEEAPAETEEDTDNGDEDDEDEAVDENEHESPPKRPRLDAEGFAIPDLPNKSGSNSSTPQRKTVGRPKGAKNWQPPPPSAAELQEEQELAEDIEEQLRQNVSLDPTGTLSQERPILDESTPASNTLPTTGPWRTEGIGPSVDSDIGNTQKDAPLPENFNDDEFEDDPDVANCVLNESERMIKETIWVTENADWLRKEHAKKIKRELKDRELREKGIDPDKERQKKLRRKDGLPRAGRAGDISYLEEGRKKKQQQQQQQRTQQGGQAKGTLVDPEAPDPAAAERALSVGAQAVEGGAGPDQDEEAQRNQRISTNARDSIQTMLQQRGTFSRRVDYEKLSMAYVLPGFEDTSSESRSESPAADPNHFFRSLHSKNARSSNRRRARETLGVGGQAGETEGEDEESNAESGELRPRSQSKGTLRGAGANSPGGSVPVPASSERQANTTSDPLQSSQASRAAKVPDGSESPLSSTHTPMGYASGAPNTPRTIRKLDAEADEDGDEEDEDEDEDEDEEEEEEDPDVYFGGSGGEVLMGDAEEVVEE